LSIAEKRRLKGIETIVTEDGLEGFEDHFRYVVRIPEVVDDRLWSPALYLKRTIYDFSIRDIRGIQRWRKER